MSNDSKKDRVCPISGSDICELSALNRGIQDLKTEVQRLRSHLSQLSEKVGTHARVLFGNGKTGMKEGYDKMTVKVGALLWLNGIAAAALIGNLIAAIAGAYK